MAKVPQNTSDLGDPPPVGTYLAVCTEVIDLYGVQRKKFQSEEMETTDVTRFVYGVKTKAGLFKIGTREMKITGSPKSNFMKTLKGWLGELPKPGFDTESLVGKGAQITVIEEVSKSSGKSYRNIGSVTPVMEGMEAKIPKPEEFAHITGNAADDDDPQAGVGKGAKGNAAPPEDDDIPF